VTTALRSVSSLEGYAGFGKHSLRSSFRCTGSRWTHETLAARRRRTETHFQTRHRSREYAQIGWRM